MDATSEVLTGKPPCTPPLHLQAPYEHNKNISNNKWVFHKKVTVRVWWLSDMEHFYACEWPKIGRYFPLFFRISKFFNIICFSGCLLARSLTTHEFPCFTKCFLSAGPHSMGWVDRRFLRETRPLTIIRVEIYTLNNLFLLGLGFIYWMSLPLGPVGCSARFYLIREWGGCWRLWSACLQAGALSPGTTLTRLL